MPMERFGGGAGCPTRKRTFPTRRAAKRYMKRRPRGNHRRTYRCDDCTFWHVTSADADTTSKIREAKREQTT